MNGRSAFEIEAFEREAIGRGGATDIPSLDAKGVPILVSIDTLATAIADVPDVAIGSRLRLLQDGTRILIQRS